MITVLLVDDQELMRIGFRMVLDAADGVEVVGEAADGEQAVAAALRLRPHIVLMDVRMPLLDGVAATAQITQDSPVKVLIMSTFDLDEYVVPALRAGASGFLLKDTLPVDLVAAVRAVAAGDAVVSPRVTRRLLDRFITPHQPRPLADTAVLGRLTDREREVLVLLSRGLSNQEMADHLGLSLTTVKSHVAHVLAKLGTRDRMQAVIVAYETGLVRPGERPAGADSVAARPRG